MDNGKESYQEAGAEITTTRYILLRHHTSCPASRKVG